MPDAEIDPLAPPARSISLRLTRWPNLVTDWSVAYGKNANLVVGVDKTLSCAEAEVVRRLRAGGYETVWIDNFGAAPDAWRWASGRDSSLPAKIFRRHIALKERVREQTGKGGGCWDVVALRGSELTYLECKGPGDSIKPGQRAWRVAGADVDPTIQWVLVQSLPS